MEFKKLVPVLWKVKDAFRIVGNWLAGRAIPFIAWAILQVEYTFSNELVEYGINHG